MHDYLFPYPIPIHCLVVFFRTTAPCLARDLLSTALMKIALPIRDARISPVFDVAKRLLVVDVEDDRQTGQDEHDLGQTDLPERARQIAGLGIDVLICGAISHPLEELLLSGGVRVVPFICGPVQKAIEAFLSNRLWSDSFLMPGCRRQQRHLREGG